MNAVITSVMYRLAPEYPFFTAVKDRVCVLLYLAANAESLGINILKICLSGFSAGENLCFSVFLYLYAHLEALKAQGLSSFFVISHLSTLLAWYSSVECNSCGLTMWEVKTKYTVRTLGPIGSGG